MCKFNDPKQTLAAMPPKHWTIQWIFSLSVSINYYYIFVEFYYSSSIWISETKRKRHDMTPVSKSAASSGLLNAIERNRGMLLNIFWFDSYITSWLDLSNKKHKRKTVPSPLTTDSEEEDEPLPKHRRVGHQNSNISTYLSSLNVFLVPQFFFFDYH